MMQPSSLSRPRLQAISAMMVAVVTLLIPQPVQARAGRTGHRDLVRCTPAHHPVQLGPMAGGASGVLAQGARGRFFAPTRQAVFYSHAGDRCLWHAGTRVRG